MKRWWLPLALILSLGINVGIFATLALRRPEPPAVDPAEDPEITEAPVESGQTSPPRGGDLPPRFVEGEGPPRDRGRGPAAMLEHLVERLGLEGEERRRFIAIQRQLFDGQRAMRERLGPVQRRLRYEVTAAEPDPEALKQALQELHRLQLERDQHFIRSILESRQVLNPEQERLYLRFVSFITRRAFEEHRRGGGPPRPTDTRGRDRRFEGGGDEDRPRRRTR